MPIFQNSDKFSVWKLFISEKNVREKDNFFKNFKMVLRSYKMVLKKQEKGKKRKGKSNQVRNIVVIKLRKSVISHSKENVFFNIP